MIDTHCHLTDPRLGDQLDAVIARAAAMGVSRIVTIACEPEDARAAVALCEERPSVRCAVGIHPTYCNDVEIEAVQEIRALHAHPSVVALGEMGLDYHWKTVPHDRQRRFFEAQLALAAEVDKPVVLHSREAIADTLDVLRAFPMVQALFHSFTGTPDEAAQIIGRGYMIGFTGPVTYKKNDALREAAKACPIERIVVETDAPWLSPEPVRSQRVNEPGFVMHVARRIAEVKGIPFDAFDAATTANALRFFRWGN
jgi:TatD DNase family protein